MKWYLNGWKKYTAFSGRASRTEFWMFFLFNTLFAIIAMLLDIVYDLCFVVGNWEMPFGILYALYGLSILLPYLAVTVRRLHDADKSGGWIFISLIPCIGWIWLIVLLCFKGSEGENQFGEVPKLQIEEAD